MWSVRLSARTRWGSISRNCQANIQYIIEDLRHGRTVLGVLIGFGIRKYGLMSDYRITDYRYMLPFCHVLRDMPNVVLPVEGQDVLGQHL